jgi:hypothetical protein
MKYKTLQHNYRLISRKLHVIEASPIQIQLAKKDFKNRRFLKHHKPELEMIRQRIISTLAPHRATAGFL